MFNLSLVSGGPIVYGNLSITNGPLPLYFIGTGNITRYYPIYVYYNGTSIPTPNTYVNITNVTNQVIWEGTTDSNGYVEANITYQKGTGNQFDAAYSIATPFESQTFGLLTTTPVILSGGPASNLTIWDDTDTTAKYPGERVNFYANFTNLTGDSINGTNVNCSIVFNMSGTFEEPVNMTFNTTSRLYEYNRTFATFGLNYWTATCNGTAMGYDVLNVTDDVDITPKPTCMISGEHKDSLDSFFTADTSLYNTSGLVGTNSTMAIYNFTVECNQNYTLKIVPDAGVMPNFNELIINDINLTQNITSFIKLDSNEDLMERADFVENWSQAAAWEPNLSVTYSSITVNMTYNGTRLGIFKCLNWNFTGNNCTDDNWTLISGELNGIGSFVENFTPGDPMIAAAAMPHVETFIEVYDVTGLNEANRIVAGNFIGKFENDTGINFTFGKSYRIEIYFNNTHELGNTKGIVKDPYQDNIPNELVIDVVGSDAPNVTDVSGGVTLGEFSAVIGAGTEADTQKLTWDATPPHKLVSDLHYGELAKAWYVVDYTGIVESTHTARMSADTEGQVEGIAADNVFITNFNSANLSIWDDTDTTTKYINQQVNFYANYTNTTGYPINGTNVTCEIKFNLTGAYVGNANMTFNVTSLLYEYNRTFTTSGNYSWNVFCNGTSEGHEIAIANAAVNITFDNIPPLIQYESPTENSGDVVIRTYILVNVSASDAQSGLKNITINLFNSTGDMINTSNSTAASLYVNFSGLSDGIYYFNATAYDNDGTANYTATRNVTVDTIGPGIIIETPTNTTYSNATILVNITTTGSPTNVWFFNGTANQSYTPGSPIYVNFTDGSNTLYAYANDSAGNYNSTNVTFALDATYPWINFTSPTPDDAITTSNTSVQINVSITESNINSVFYNWNNTNYTVYNDSLVLMMTFDNISALGENDSKVVDISRSGNNGTVLGPIWNTSAKYGGAYQFDGVDDYINLSATPTTGTGSFSIFSWIKTTNTAKRKQIVAYGSEVLDQGVWLFVNTANQVETDLSNRQGPSSSVTVTDGTWHHVGVVNNAGTFQIYVDGTASGSSSVLAPTITSGDARIGKEMSVFNQPTWRFNGSIDEVRVWNRSLSSAEVYEQYVSNLNKFNSTQWNLYVNKSRNATAGLASGTYTYQAFASDTFGNLNTTEQRTITIDTIAPSIMIESPANTTYNNLTVLVNITTSGESSVWFFNGTANQSYNPGTPVYVTFSEGSNIVYAYANDSVGNLNSTNISFTVDTTAPGIIIESPANATYGSKTILVNITTSGSPSGVWFFNGTDNQSYTPGSPVYVNFSEGSNTIYAYVNDSVGNFNSTNISFSIDSTPPSITIESPLNITYGTGMILVNITVTDQSPVTTSYNWNGTNVTYAAPVYVNFSDGSNTLYAYANDSFGHSSVANVSFNVDTALPTILFIGPTPANNARLIANALTINVTVNDSDSNIDQCTVQINNVNYTMTKDGIGKDVICNYTHSPLVRGTTYTYKVYANDSLTNMGISAAQSNLYNSLPVMDSHTIDPSLAYTNTDLICNASGTDADLDVLQYNYSWYVNDIYKTNTQILTSNQFVKHDNVTCNVTAYDSYEYSNLSNASITILNSLPTINPVAGDTLDADEDSLFTYTFTATDNDSDALNFTDNTLLFDISNAGQISFTPTNSQVGSYSVIITANDSENTTNYTITFDVNNVNDAPVINLSTFFNGTSTTTSNITPSEINASENTTLRFNASAYDIDAGDSIQYNWFIDSILTAITQFVDIVLGFDEPAQRNVTLMVNDTTNTQTFFTWLLGIINVNRYPVISDYAPVAQLSIYENASNTLSANYSDPDNDSLTVEWYYDTVMQSTQIITNTNVNKTSSYQFNTSFTDEGVHNITLVVKDAQYQAKQEWNITVINVNRLPRLLNETIYAVEDENKTFNLSTLFIDDDGDPITIANITHLDNHTSCAFGGNIMNLTPRSDYNGYSNISINVTDSINSTLKQVKIKVISVPDINASGFNATDFASLSYVLKDYDYTYKTLNESTFLQNGNCSIQYRTSFNVTQDYDFNAHTSFLHGKLYFDDGNLAEFNKPAHIIFYNITEYNTTSDFYIVKDGATCTDCTNTTLQNNTVSFDVAGFSTYELLSGAAPRSSGGSSSRCEENWVCTDWTCYENNTRTRTCTDLSYCGNLRNRPNLTEPCSYSCIQKYICDSWNDCVNSTQTRKCVDENSCYAANTTIYQAQSCIAAPELESEKSEDHNVMQCSPDMRCTYGQCINGKQTRYCYDILSCGYYMPENNTVACGNIAGFSFQGLPIRNSADCRQSSLFVNALLIFILIYSVLYHYADNSKSLSKALLVKLFNLLSILLILLLSLHLVLFSCSDYFAYLGMIVIVLILVRTILKYDLDYFNINNALKNILRKERRRYEKMEKRSKAIDTGIIRKRLLEQRARYKLLKEKQALLRRKMYAERTARLKTDSYEKEMIARANAELRRKRQQEYDANAISDMVEFKNIVGLINDYHAENDSRIKQAKLAKAMHALKSASALNKLRIRERFKDIKF